MKIYTYLRPDTVTHTELEFHLIIFFQVLHEQGQVEDAAETLREAASLGVNVARLWRTLGHCLYEMDKVHKPSIFTLEID